MFNSSRVTHATNGVESINLLADKCSPTSFVQCSAGIKSKLSSAENSHLLFKMRTAEVLTED